MSDLIRELTALQRAYNEWWKRATPEERSRDARAGLRYIGEVDESAPDWYREIEVDREHREDS